MIDTRVSGKTGLTAAAGVGSGVAIAPLIVWLADLAGVDMPSEVATIIGGMLAAVAAIAVAYFVPAKSGSNVDYAPDPDAFEVIEGEQPGGDFEPEPAPDVEVV